MGPEESKGDENALPMVVWLRGDEPLFEAFSLSADQVMQQLGIKRSRLNQIAGRDLRVGRARIGQYIRPIFRPEDVEAYLEWVRPTASHKKSTQVLEEARLRLEDHSRRLGASFREATGELSREWSYQLGRWQRELCRIQAEWRAQDADAKDHEDRDLRRRLERADAAIQSLADRSEERWQQVEDSLRSLTESVARFAGQTRYIENTLHQLQEQQARLEKRLDPPFERPQRRYRRIPDPPFTDRTPPARVTRPERPRT